MRKITVLLMMLVGLMWATSALALPTPPASYVWSNADYWTITDLSANQGTFELAYENAGASLESSFGLYTVAADDSLLMHEVFSANQEPTAPGDAFETLGSVWFQYDAVNSKWQISSTEDGTYNDFGLKFGFYSDVYNSAGELQNTWYTDVQYNSNGSDIEHFAIAYSALYHDTKIFMEDLARGFVPTDSYDMLVQSDDLAPVPEPGTLLLLGGGLVGLAYLRKRKKA